MLTYPVGLPDIYANPIDISFHLWVTVIAALFLFGINFFIQATRIKDLPSQRTLLFGYGIFMIFIGIGRIFVLIAYDPVTPHSMFDQLDVVQTIFSQLSVIPAIWALEKYILPQTKHIFTDLAVAVAAWGALPIILNNTNNDTIMIGKVIGVIPLFAVFAILFIFLIKRTSGSIRRQAIQIFLGLAITAIGMLFDNNKMIITGFPPLWVSPTIYLAGVIIFGFSIHLEKSRAK